jgi:hypothetical protein
MKERYQGKSGPATEEIREAQGTRILLRMFDLIQKRTGRPDRECFNQLVRFWADCLRVHPMPEEDHAVADGLLPSAKPFIEACMQRKGDYFGEVFTRRECATDRLGQMITPEPVVRFINEMAIGQTEGKEEEWQTVLDPAAGTGRFLVDVAARYPDRHLFLHGVEIDVDLYRACLVNMRLYSWHRPYRILCANSLVVDLRLRSPNWHYANLWSPPDWRMSMIMEDGQTYSQRMGEGGVSVSESGPGREEGLSERPRSDEGPRDPLQPRLL